MFNSTMLMSSFIPLVFPTNTKCLFDFHNMTRLIRTPVTTDIFYGPFSVRVNGV